MDNDQQNQLTDKEILTIVAKRLGKLSWEKRKSFHDSNYFKQLVKKRWDKVKAENNPVDNSV